MTDIKNFIEDESKKGSVKILIYENKSGRMISNLSFKDGKFEGLEGSITIDGYMNRIVQFCTKDILIYINEILITDIKPRKIYQLEYFPEQEKTIDNE